MSSLYYIHVSSNTPVNQATAKACLMQMVSIVFKKMETFAVDFSESLRRLNSDFDSNRQRHSTTGNTKSLQDSHADPELRDDSFLQPPEQNLVTFTADE